MSVGHLAPLHPPAIHHSQRKGQVARRWTCQASLVLIEMIFWAGRQTANKPMYEYRNRSTSKELEETQG